MEKVQLIEGEPKGLNAVDATLAIQATLPFLMVLFDAESI